MANTALTLTELLNPPSTDQLLDQIKNLFGTMNFSPTDWESDSDGSVIIQVLARLLSSAYANQVLIAEEGYLDTATGSWLDLLAQSQYQLTRDPAVQTIGLFNLTTASGTGPYTFNAGDLVVTAIGTDGVTPVTFRSTNATPVTVNAGPATASIQMSADVPSSNANISPHYPDFIIQTPRPGLQVDNNGSQTPAQIIFPLNTGGLLLNGKTLVISTTPGGGAPTGNVTLTFTSNFTSISGVSTALNILIGLSGLAGKVTSTIVNGQLVIRTTLAGTYGPPGFNIDTLTIAPTGTANIVFGLDTASSTTSNGTYTWITQYGQDPETDASLVQRCKDRWASVGTGTAEAFISWATSADPQVQKVIVYSNFFNGTPKSGAITLYIAPFSGVWTPPADAPHVANVYNYINPRLPIMTQLFVGPAIATGVTIDGTVKIHSNVNNPNTQALISGEIANFFNRLSIGDILYHDQLLCTIIGVPGVIDASFTLNASNGDLPGGLNKIFTLSANRLTYVSV